MRAAITGEEHDGLREMRRCVRNVREREESKCVSRAPVESDPRMGSDIVGELGQCIHPQENSEPAVGDRVRTSDIQVATLLTSSQK